LKIIKREGEMKNIVNSWDKVYRVFDDYMSDIEFMPKDKITPEIEMAYKAMLYTNNQIKKWVNVNSNEKKFAQELKRELEK